MVVSREVHAEAARSVGGAGVALAGPQDYAHCRAVMERASKNYSFAGRFLPAEKRPHVEALYAFLRVGDDRVDVSHKGFASAEAAIADWERAYRRAFARRASADPVLRAYLHTAETFGIPESVMDPFFAAMRADLSVTRFATFADLLTYMAGSAVPVGRAMTYILGVRTPHEFGKALARADSLSIAMQLSNFWRDIGEDWRRGRVYLPQEDLAAYGVRERDLAGDRATLALRRLLRYQSDRTEIYYRQAQEGIPMLASGRWGVQSGLHIYRAILTALRANGFDPFSRRAGPGDLSKAWLVARAWFESR